eukprot:10858937-Lingulodinium_polyedra.AAC.1
MLAGARADVSARALRRTGAATRAHARWPNFGQTLDADAGGLALMLMAALMLMRCADAGSDS